MKDILRKCQGCGQVLPRESLIKITKSAKTGEIKINPPSNFGGRSLYLCKTAACLKEIIKKKRLMREFKMKSQEEVLFFETELKNLINNLPQ